MSDTVTTEVGTVGIPVTDQDRAPDCYVDKLGFDKHLFALRGSDGNSLILVGKA